jgi:hypothetical protein
MSARSAYSIVQSDRTGLRTIPDSAELLQLRPGVVWSFLQYLCRRGQLCGDLFRMHNDYMGAYLSSLRWSTTSTHSRSGMPDLRSAASSTRTNHILGSGQHHLGRTASRTHPNYILGGGQHHLGRTASRTHPNHILGGGQLRLGRTATRPIHDHRAKTRKTCNPSAFATGLLSGL